LIHGRRRLGKLVSSHPFQSVLVDRAATSPAVRTDVLMEHVALNLIGVVTKREDIVTLDVSQGIAVLDLVVLARLGNLRADLPQARKNPIDPLDKHQKPRVLDNPGIPLVQAEVAVTSLVDHIVALTARAARSGTGAVMKLDTVKMAVKRNTVYVTEIS
jgi:hypothetical protein